MNALTGLNFIGRIAGSSAVGLAASTVSSPYMQPSLLILDVPVTVVAAAALGAAASLAFGDPVPSRRQLYSTILASTIFGAVTSWLTSHAFGWQWAQDAPGASACVSAAIIRLFFPAVIARAKQLIADFKFSFSLKKGEGE